MKVLLLFSIVTMTQLLYAQSVTLDWSHPINNEHSRKNEIQKLGQEYVYKIYAIHQKIEAKEFYTHSESKHDRLVFSIKEDDKIYLDTFRYTIYPNRERTNIESSFEFDLPEIRGKLPKDIMTWQSDSRKYYEIGVMLQELGRYVRIDVLDSDKNLITTLVDRNLKKGTFEFKFPLKQLKDDVFHIQYTIDDYQRTHIILADSKFDLSRTFLGRFWDRIIN